MSYGEYKVTLTGLNARQVNILDMMWSLDSTEAWDDWFDTLDENTAFDALVLREMVLLEINDHEAEKDLSLAQHLLAKLVKC
jgi:hypothetical protein